MKVLDDICEEVGTLHATTWRIIAKLGEVDMKVVVRRLVVQVDSQLAGWEAVVLQDGLLTAQNTSLDWCHNISSKVLK